MDELIKMITKKTGLSEAMAKTIITMVVNFLKKRLPESVAGKLDVALKNPTAIDTAKKLIGGLKKKIVKKIR